MTSGPVAADVSAILDLLPAVYRERDARLDGKPGLLESLLGVIAGQIGIVHDDLDQLYDDLFIETCAAWVVPYIGDLVAVTPGAPLGDGEVLSRSAVADAIALRRRKGTAAVLEQLARDVLGRPAVAVEMFRRMAIAQHLQHVVAGRGTTVSLRSAAPLERIGTAFDTAAHTLEVRRIGSGAGRYDVQNVAIVVWRDLLAPRSWVDAAVVDDRRYRFDVLGCDRPLVTRPAAEVTIVHQASSLNVPLPISRRAMAAQLADYYGNGLSVAVRVDGSADTIDIGDVVVCDLGDAAPDGLAWSNVARLTGTQVGIDPQLGRLAFATAQADAPQVSSCTAVPRYVGGGELADRPSLPADAPMAIVSRNGTGGAATSIGAAVAASGGVGVVEVTDNRTYAGDLAVTIPPATRLRIAGRVGTYPHVALTTSLTVTVGEGGILELAGLLVSGGPLVVRGRPDAISLTDCTFVPGQRLGSDGGAAVPVGPSLVIAVDADWQTEITIANCIAGPLFVPADGNSLTLTDSIVDCAGGAFPGTTPAIAADGAGGPGAALTMSRCTVLGAVSAQRVDLISDSIITGPTSVDRRQVGCVQYSWIEPGSQTPRRHQCQPATAITPRPAFVSTRFDTPGYGRLRRAHASALVRGASDGYEMGAMATLGQTQRDDNLRRSIEEFLRFGLEAGVLDGS